MACRVRGFVVGRYYRSGVFLSVPCHPVILLLLLLLLLASRRENGRIAAAAARRVGDGEIDASPCADAFSIQRNDDDDDDECRNTASMPTDLCRAPRLRLSLSVSVSVFECLCDFSSVCVSVRRHEALKS